MPSIDETAKNQFAKIFTKTDWRDFRDMADRYFERSARLRKADLSTFPSNMRLLARNIEKRLFIGIGTELLLKAVHLKHGFIINKPLGGPQAGLQFPFTKAQAVGILLDAGQTYMLNDLIQCLHRVPAIGSLGSLEKGLRIAKVFRNKEGHVVVRAHKFDPCEYDEIEQALVGVYLRGFGETLNVQFSMKPKQKAQWKLS